METLVVGALVLVLLAVAGWLGVLLRAVLRSPAPPLTPSRDRPRDQSQE